MLNLVPLRLLRQILGESPALEVSKASGDGILDVPSFLKALLKNLLLPVAPPAWSPWSLCCTYLCFMLLLTLVCPLVIDVAVVVV